MSSCAKCQPVVPPFLLHHRRVNRLPHKDDDDDDDDNGGDGDDVKAGLSVQQQKEFDSWRNLCRAICVIRVLHPEKRPKTKKKPAEKRKRDSEVFFFVFFFHAVSQFFNAVRQY